VVAVPLAELLVVVQAVGGSSPLAHPQAKALVIVASDDQGAVRIEAFRRLRFIH
jgi:hypothetical protein